MKLKDLIEDEFYLYEYLDSKNSFLLQYKYKECISSESHYPLYQYNFIVISSDHYGFQSGDKFWIIQLHNSATLKKL